MKLHEIKPLKESTTPIHISMLLQEICKAGKITNMAQTLVVAQMVQLFKIGLADANNPAVYMGKAEAAQKPRYAWEEKTPKALIDEIKALSGEDACKLASWCLIRLGMVEAEEKLEQYRDPSTSLAQWISYVTKAQD